jgi:hypothetical protein
MVQRSALIGSIVAARHAGMQVAATPPKSSIDVTTPIVVESVGLIP